MTTNLAKPVLSFVVILALWGIFTLLPLRWSTLAPATCLQTGCFCERIQPGSLAQPVNSWSSLAFCLPGLLILDDKRKNHLFNEHRSHRWTFGLALLVIGLGSAFYHASLSFVGQFLDVLGMYLLISFATLFGLARVGILPARLFPVGYGLVNLLLAGVLLWLPVIRREVFLVLVLLTLGVEGYRILHRQTPELPVYFLAALGSLGLATLIWQLDNSGVLCSPASILQGHAVWHGLGALSAWFLYKYYQK